MYDDSLRISVWYLIFAVVDMFSVRDVINSIGTFPDSLTFSNIVKSFASFPDSTILEIAENISL